MGKPKKCGMLHLMTDTSCGEETLHPREVYVCVCCRCNLSGREDVSHVEGKVKDVCVTVQCTYSIHWNLKWLVCAYW